MGMYLSYNIWQYFIISLLEDEVLEYSIFIKMKDTLLRDETKTREA
ncbi:23189_t:CDS:1, partial [Racocetra persica]